MNQKFYKITKNIKFQIFIAFLGILFLFKLFFSPLASFPWLLLNDIFVVLTASSLIIYLIDLIKYKTVTPLSLVMNVGILNAVIFFVISFSDFFINGLFENPGESINNSDLIYTAVSFFYVFIILGSVAYIFLAFKELFFLKQKKNLNIYFSTMVLFFILASVTNVVSRSYPDLAYINNTFFIISIILILLNSIRISWIAFIIKKEKIILLVLSIVISVLFIVNLVNSGEKSVHNNVITAFSPALKQFFNIMMIYGAIYFSILFFTTLFHIPTAEAFDRKAQEVSSLQYFSKLITQVLDFNELADTVTDIATKIGNADAAWIVLKENNSLKTFAYKNVGFVDADLMTKYAFERIKGESNENPILFLKNFTEKKNLNDNFSCVAVSPLKTHNEIKGYLLAAKKGDFIFDDEDKNAIYTFADYASVALENSRLLGESIEKERLEKELDLAREIQRKILPAKNPDFKKLDISSLFIPAFEVGGDYYDFFNISENRLGFIIADVSGKGISAAFIMAEIKGIFQSLSSTYDSPKEILARANQIIKGTLDRKSFISAAYGVIDFEKEILTIARAGHCPVLLLRENESKKIQPRGIGLGLIYSDYFKETLEEIQINLKENDTLVLYTDGITESKNSELDDFGDLNFEKILLENIYKSAEEISNKVIKEVTLFTNGSSQHDDITLVIFKWKSRHNRDKQKTNDGDKEWQISTPQLKTTAI